MPDNSALSRLLRSKSWFGGKFVNRWLAVWLVVGAAAVLWGYGVIERNRHLAHAELELTKTGEAKIRRFEEWILEKQSAVGAHLDLLNASSVFQEWDRAGQPADFEPLLRILTIIRSAGEFVDLQVWDRRTDNVISLSGSPIDAGSLSQKMQHFEPGHRSQMGDFLQAENDQLVIPVYAVGRGGEELDPESRVLVVLIDPRDIIFPILADWRREYRSGELLIVDRDGENLRLVRPDRESDSELVAMSEDELPAAMAVAGKSGLVEGRDYRGRKVLAYIDHVSGSNWWIVIKIDRAEVLALARGPVWVMATLLGGLVGFIALILEVFMWREAKQKFAERIGASKKMERRFRDAIDGAPVPAMIIAENGRILEVNRAWLKITGYSTDELRTIDDWIFKAFPDGDASARRHFDRTFDPDRGDSLTTQFNCEIRTAAGKLRYWTCGTAITGELPDGLRVATTFATDVTAARAAEAEAKDTLEMVNAMFYHAATGLISYRADGQAIVANPAAAKITGGSIEQLEAMNFNQTESWQQSGLVALAQQALDANATVEVDVEFETTYGRSVALVGSFVPFRHADECWLLFAFSDEKVERDAAVALEQHLAQQQSLNAKLEAEVAMHRSTIDRHRLLQRALEAVPSTVVITDPAGIIEWVNPAFSEMTGYGPGEVVGKSTNVLRSGRHDDTFYRKLWETISNGEVWSGELENRRKDGTVYWESMVIAPVLSESRSITHYVAIKRDITEQRFLEEQYTRAQRMESIGMLAGGLSHDLNNVLSPIMMGLELFKMRSTKQTDIDRLEMLIKSAERGAGIVRQVLTFARGVDGERAPLNPISLVKEVVSFLTETLPPGIEITTEFGENVRRVMADVTQIHQVLINLGVNARDAMPEGGELSMKVKETLIKKEVVTRSGLKLKPGTYVEFEISDTGTGIPSEIVDRIFDPFFTTKPRGRGTGLGLSSVHGIVRGHEGAIDLHSVVGKGTQFHLYLPVCKLDETEVPTSSLVRPDGKGRVVLVVDDEEPVRMIMAMTLEDCGFTVDQAVDGQDAIDKFSANPDRYHVVVLDLLMPRVNGGKVAEMVKGLRPKVPIVLSSGVLSDANAPDESLRTYRSLGDYVMKKPFSASRLLSVVHQALGGPGDDEKG